MVVHMSADFQIAVERAQTLIGAPAWKLLSLHEQAEAIYEQLRLLDAERWTPKPVP
jgi:hypothetical protein